MLKSQHYAPKIKYAGIRVNMEAWPRIVINAVICVEFLKRYRSDKKTHFMDIIDIL